MAARTSTACETCRTTRKRCAGGPPCQNCVEPGKESCEFVLTATSRKRVAQQARIESDACGPCHTNSTLCRGGPPCEECVLRGNGTCTFELDSRSEKHLARGRSACLPCRAKKIRCTGKGPPCVSCTLRGIESTCEFAKTVHTKPTISHTPLCQSDIPAESSWNAVLEKAPVQQAESPLHEESDSSPSSYTSTFAALDTRRAFHDESKGVTTPLSKTSSLTALSELGRTPSPDVSSSDNAVDASSLAGCASYEQLLDVLPNREMIDHLIERYFTSISMVKLAYQTAEICSLTSR